MSLFRRPTSRRGAAAPTPPAEPREVVLLTKPGCHLCHKARAAAGRVAAELGAPVREVNIEEEPARSAYWDAYWDKIPVTMVGGEVVDVWHVNEERLRAALGGAS